VVVKSLQQFNHINNKQEKRAINLQEKYEGRDARAVMPESSAVRHAISDAPKFSRTLWTDLPEGFVLVVRGLLAAFAELVLYVLWCSPLLMFFLFFRLRCAALSHQAVGDHSPASCRWKDLPGDTCCMQSGGVVGPCFSC
jgi:hypothetical protein